MQLQGELYKPRIYLHRYKSGVAFWRVFPLSKLGIRWHRLSDYEKLIYTHAIRHCAKLNLEVVSKWLKK